MFASPQVTSQTLEGTAPASQPSAKLVNQPVVLHQEQNPETCNLTEGKFIWLKVFRGFSPWVFDSKAQSAWRKGLVEEMTPPMAARKQRKKEDMRDTSYLPQLHLSGHLKSGPFPTHSHLVTSSTMNPPMSPVPMIQPLPKNATCARKIGRKF